MSIKAGDLVFLKPKTQHPSLDHLDETTGPLVVVRGPYEKQQIIKPSNSKGVYSKLSLSVDVIYQNKIIEGVPTGVLLKASEVNHGRE
jgi:hypothetical protein